MPMFKNKHKEAPMEPRGQQISRPFETSNAKTRTLASAPCSPRSPAVGSPSSDNYPSRQSARRTILRNPRDSCLSVSNTLSPHSRASLLLASSANPNGFVSRFPASPSSPAFYHGMTAGTPTWNVAAPVQNGVSASVSLPQMALYGQQHYGGPIYPLDASTMPNPYESSFVSSNHSRGSTSTRPSVIVRPLHIRKNLNPPFPFPTEAAALHTLARVLRTETKKFRISDFIDIEEGEFAALVEAKERERDVNHDAMPHSHAARGNHSRPQLHDPQGRTKSMWDGEEEDETVTDCVRDKMDDGQGGASRWKSEREERSEKRRREREMRLKDLHLFGTHLEDLPDFALSPVIIGGYLHEVPTAVAAAIEELVIARLKEPNFFNSRPDRKQLFELVSRFDQLVATNAFHGQLVPPPSLSNELTQSIYSLLVTYLSALPHTIIPRPLVDALWCWCVSPSVTRAQRARIVRNDSEDSESENESSDEEDGQPNYAERLRQREREFLDLPSFRVQIRIARHVLLLLSRRQFSLLIYLMNFIRAVLHLDGDSDKEGDQTSNGVALHDIARAFGGVLLGGRNWKKRNSIKYHNGMPANGDRDRTSKEQKIMTWLVNHWGRIASAYELDESPDERVGEDGARSRAASLSRPGNSERVMGKAAPIGHDEIPRAVSRLSPQAPVEGGNSKQDHPQRVSRVPNSERQSLSSGETADSTSSSDWEELPIVSTCPTHSNGKGLDRGSHGKNEPQQYTLSTLLDREAGHEDILEYYSGDSRGITSVTPAFERKDGQAEEDDEISLYSTDDAELERGFQIRPEHLGAEQDSATKADATQALANEVVALRKQLLQVRDERDQARQMVDAMRKIIGTVHI